MRPSILPNLIQAAARNAARGYADIALFEVGPVFHEKREAAQATVAAGIRAGRRGPRHWSGRQEPVDAFDAKRDALGLLAALGFDPAKATVDANPPAWFHPGQAGSLRLGPTALGAFGSLHPDVLEALGLDGPCVGFEIDLGAIPSARRKGTERPPLALSPFQPVTRDFAFVVDSGVKAADIVRAAQGADKKLITAVTVFDVYEGKGIEAGKKSIAIAVTIQPREKTMTDAEIDALGQKIVADISKRTGGVLRG